MADPRSNLPGDLEPLSPWGDFFEAGWTKPCGEQGKGDGDWELCSGLETLTVGFWLPGRAPCGSRGRDSSSWLSKTFALPSSSLVLLGRARGLNGVAP